MKIEIADIEADGLLDSISTVWKLRISDLDTPGVTDSYNDSAPNAKPLSEGYARLLAADKVVFHNGIGYDWWAIMKVAGIDIDWTKIIDTMVLSKLGNPERPGQRPHSLDTWGERVGIPKPTHTDWTKWSYKMEHRCEQDVEITRKVFGRLKGMLEIMPEAVEIEHRAHWEAAKVMNVGFGIDVAHCRELASKLTAKKEGLFKDMSKIFPPILVAAAAPKDKFVKTLKIVNKNHKLRGLLDPGVPYCPLEIEEFKPSSRPQAAKRLITKYGWKPYKFTPGGAPEVSEEILRELPYPEAAPLADYMEAVSMLAKIEGPPKADGSGGGWLHHTEGDRCYAKINACKAVTHRPSCYAPPLQGVPTGAEYRSAFVAAPGWQLVGVDAEGIELRCLGHYLWPFDNGDYAREVVEGDIHTRVMDMIGLRLSDDPYVVKTVNRAITKNIEYSIVYGSGDARLGRYAAENAQKTGVPINYAAIEVVPRNPKRAPSHSAVGAGIRDKIETGIVGFGDLVRDVKKKARKNGKLRAIDGRTLWIRSDHAALNSLLQSMAILVMKKSMGIIEEFAYDLGLEEGTDYRMVMWVHDEFQFEVRPELTKEFGTMATEAIRVAGERLGVRCPMSGNYLVGGNWSCTH